MKVLQIANDYLGTTLYTAFFNALADAGVTNTIFVPVQYGTAYRKENDGFRNDNGSSLVISPCFSPLDRLIFYSKQKKVYAGICQAVDIANINVTHAHTLFSAGYTAMNLKKKNGIPYITAVRNSDVNVFFKKMKHLRATGVEIMQNAERVVFLSPVYKKAVLEAYVPENVRDAIESKSLVIPNGISQRFLNKQPEKKMLTGGKIRIMYAGEVNQNKNLKETVEACKILIRKGYRCSFLVVGDVTDKSCGKVLQEDFITHFPRCGQDELIHHYRANDIFVMPSHTETFGLAYAEAMSQGLPVIYTKGQGFDGQFQEGEVGYHVSDADAAELAEKIQAVVEEYRAISQRCIEKAKKFGWKGIAEKYKGIYDAV